ncbi:hypothetical protein OSB04_029240 [Centaurea solstitialis]|uniref:DUF4378 domain-containing protein n=1 Tax=Centaurea solstitialis TaxID=347529 RepID=A0AA38WA33_9ASTR|nr:hypothetical protein OSB04_029240 [Centaurea solstitialis]
MGSSSSSSHKHLHELLREDQEPFHLKNYIADRRSQLKSTTTPSSALNPLRKRKPLIHSASARDFCINHVCFFSFHDSPDVRRSPFLDFPSPAIKSPFHIPARTAAMLLDAAVRIQKQKQKQPVNKPKAESLRRSGFGLFGSLLKRLKKDRRTRIKRREIGLSSSRKRDSDLHKNSADLETCCSCSWSVHDDDDLEEIEFMGENENCFCLSPSSPFRFSLVKSPSSGHRTPDLLSPETSPTHHLQQAKSQEAHLEEEEKEQCSPVSVLDPVFEDEEEELDVVAVEDEYDLECSFANVQRAKNQLLQKLQRFEKLAKLDPIELEKHMLEQHCQEEEEDDDEDSSNEAVLRDIYTILGFGKVPAHVKRIVMDLVAEENKNEEECGVVARRVLSRLELWKMVESNTIDMMVELDFRKEKGEGWRGYNDEKIKEIGMDTEVTIFGVLMEELAQELVTISGDK